MSHGLVQAQIAVHTYPITIVRKYAKCNTDDQNVRIIITKIAIIKKFNLALPLFDEKYE
jgi:hypothetical protein